MTKLSNIHIALAAVAAGVITTPALADGPLSAKVELFSGYTDPVATTSSATKGFSGGILPTLTLDAGHGIGLQVDGLLAHYGDSTTVAGGGHIYWRNPKKGLIGITGSVSHTSTPVFFFSQKNTINDQKIAAEAEVYLNRFTLSGIAGYEHTSANLVFFPGNSTSSQFYSKANIAYYPNDNWKISVGHRYVAGVNAAAMGTELSLTGHGATGLSVFAEGRFGEKGYNAAWAGVKIYFGGKKTLIDRHRTEDPENGLKDELFVPQSPTAAPSNGSNGSYNGSYNGGCGSYNNGCA